MAGLDAVTAALEGAALACWPILLVIIAAIFTYNLAVHTKSMDIVKHMLMTVSKDRRILALLIAWGFGAFMEGMAGFGTAIAIPASMLVALGFDPIKSILVCLVANSVPTTYGSIGIPASTLANLTGLDPILLSSYISLQLLPLNLICPFLIVLIIGGSVKALKGVFLITLLSGLALALPELVIAATVGPELAVMGHRSSSWRSSSCIPGFNRRRTRNIPWTYIRLMSRSRGDCSLLTLYFNLRLLAVDVEAHSLHPRSAHGD